MGARGFDTSATKSPFSPMAARRYFPATSTRMQNPGVSIRATSWGSKGFERSRTVMPSPPAAKKPTRPETARS